MFDLTGEDIARLQPGDLRSLVARLARAELRAAGCPAAGVTAGGHENAADGGIDVRVLCPAETFRPDFIPRVETGFQVKQTDLEPGEIDREMRPDGTLRAAIATLADAGGAYIIVSGQGSTADTALTARQQAMRHALRDHAAAARLEVRFYDRTRVAAWASHYPGVAAWIRARIGRPLCGWQSIEDTAERQPFLHDGATCLTDGDGPPMDISMGITRLRQVLNSPRASARLIGLSGVGKTRLVQALFEPEVGVAPLDPAIGAYADEGEQLTPTAHEMARGLIAEGTRAVLIVDNCNPETHRELTKIAGLAGSKVSLLTVEYDVREDLPESTNVFRLQSASPALLMLWLQPGFPEVCQSDCERIAHFSEGNFRIARAIAGSISAGETLGHLRDWQLFERIVRQRNPHDEGLLKAAEDLSLLYSIDGEATDSGSELTHIGSLRGVGADALYAHLATLQQHRGIVQARGRWRAVLPQAVANALASRALDRLPPATLDRMVAALPERMQRSLTRRIGHLHHSASARAAVARWLAADGPFGDLCAPEPDQVVILSNLAPVVPNIVLNRMAGALAGPEAAALLSPRAATRMEWIRLIKALAYDAGLFDRAACLLIKFVAAEDPDTNHQSAVGAFRELFLLHLSGTKAKPEQRRALVCRIAGTADATECRLAAMALSELLRRHHFSAADLQDFGARPRDHGWAPGDQQEVDEWFAEAIAVAVMLSPVIPAARQMVADSFRELWQLPGCRAALEGAGEVFGGARAWVEGWLAARVSLRHDAGMPVDVRARLARVVEQLTPADPLDFARAVLLQSPSRGWDFIEGDPASDDPADGWKQTGEIALRIGREMAEDDMLRRRFLPEILAQRESTHQHEFGRGLAEGASDPRAIWAEMIDHMRQIPAQDHAGSVLGGYIMAGRDLDPLLAHEALEQLAADPPVAHMLPFLQALCGVDDEGIERLRRVIASRAVWAGEFNCIASSPTPVSPEGLAMLLEALADLPDGVPVCVSILYFRFIRDDQVGGLISPVLIDVGCKLLRGVLITRRGLRDHMLRNLLQRCSAGLAGAQIARDLSMRLREAVLAGDVYPNDLSGTFRALVASQPLAVLDVFVPEQPTWQDERVLHHGFGWGAALDSIDPARVREWADIAPEQRYPLLGRVLSMFTSALREKAQELSPVFMAVLDAASDRTSFLGDARWRIHPGGWSGSLAEVLEQRRSLLLTLLESRHRDVRDWVARSIPDLEAGIADQRAGEFERERQKEESFE